MREGSFRRGRPFLRWGAAPGGRARGGKAGGGLPVRAAGPGGVAGGRACGLALSVLAVVAVLVLGAGALTRPAAASGHAGADPAGAASHVSEQMLVPVLH